MTRRWWLMVLLMLAFQVAGTEGGAGGEKPADDAGDKPEGDEDEADKELGAKGQRALAVERKAREKAEKDAAKARADLEALKASGASDHEKALAAAKEEGRTGALAEANARLIAAAVQVAASGRLVKPALAVRLVDLGQFEVAADGSIDQKAIDAAIDELLEETPELAAKEPGSPKRSGGDGTGKGGDGGKKPDMNTLLRAVAGRAG